MLWIITTMALGVLIGFFVNPASSVMFVLGMATYALYLLNY